MKRLFPLLFLGGVIFFLDFFSKRYVHEHIPIMSYASSVYPYGGIGVFKDWHGIDFSLNHVINKGAAWGALAAFQDYLLALRFMIIGGMLTYLIFFRPSTCHQFSFTAILAGALGNVRDYFAYGHVVDFFHFKFWGHSFAVFNIADSAIFCGIIALILHSFLFKWKASKKSSNARRVTS